MLVSCKTEVDTIFTTLTAAIRIDREIGDGLHDRVYCRLFILQGMVIGLLESIERLKTQTFTDFPSLTKRLITLQGSIEKVRLRDGLSYESPEQLTLMTDLKRAQRLYVHHHRRNQWAAKTVKEECEALLQLRIHELLLALQDLCKILSQ